MSDGVFGVLGGMALADLDRANSQAARHNKEMAGMMEYQGNVAVSTLDVARDTLKYSRSAFEQGKLNMGAIDRNVREIREAKAVIEDTRTGLRVTLDVTKEARNNTRNLMDLVTGMHQTQVQMIDVMERMSKRDDALLQEVHELRDLVARSNGPSPD